MLVLGLRDLAPLGSYTFAPNSNQAQSAARANLGSKLFATPPMHEVRLQFWPFGKARL